MVITESAGCIDLAWSVSYPEKGTPESWWRTIVVDYVVMRVKFAWFFSFPGTWSRLVA